MIFYTTVAANHPHGPGYWEIHATSEEAARQKAFDFLPEGKWACMYDTLNEVHPLDRKRIGAYYDHPTRRQGSSV